MIHLLKGLVIHQQHEILIVQVAAIGLYVTIPTTSSYMPGSEVELHTYMHWHQETGPSLYGFSESAQRDIFCMLIGVSGIGPRMALALLSTLSISTIINALIEGNSSVLSSVSGIGKKKAETLILHLKDKAEKISFRPYSSAITASEFATHLKDLSEALISLGYSRHEVVQAVEQVRTLEKASSLSFDQLLRNALRLVSKKTNS